MTIALIILGVWIVFALAWGHGLVLHNRRRNDWHLSLDEVWQHGEAARRWMKTGDLETARRMLRR